MSTHFYLWIVLQYTKLDKQFSLITSQATGLTGVKDYRVYIL